jgi:hypothetical protein
LGRHGHLSEGAMFEKKLSMWCRRPHRLIRPGCLEPTFQQIGGQRLAAPPADRDRSSCGRKPLPQARQLVPLCGRGGVLPLLRSTRVCSTPLRSDDSVRPSPRAPRRQPCPHREPACRPCLAVVREAAPGPPTLRARHRGDRPLLSEDVHAIAPRSPAIENDGVVRRMRRSMARLVHKCQRKRQIFQGRPRTHSDMQLRPLPEATTATLTFGPVEWQT